MYAGRKRIKSQDGLQSLSDAQTEKKITNQRGRFMQGSKEDILKYLETNSVPEPMTGCILWTAGSDKDGYGKIAVNGKDWRAHRLSFHLHNGPVTTNILVCHKCDTPSCINPSHLFAGDPLVNMQDKVRKGRLKNQNINKSHCKHGHAFVSDNIRWSLTSIGNPRRTCIVCYTARHKKRNAEKRLKTEKKITKAHDEKHSSLFNI